MTVRVVMFASSFPEGSSEDDRVIEYKDSGGSKYTYNLHASGALFVFKKADGSNGLEVVYGPSAWESVQGDGGSGR